MASSDLPDVPPGTELDTYAAEVDLSQPQLQMTPDGMITEPVLGIRMLMSSRVSWIAVPRAFRWGDWVSLYGSHCVELDIRLPVYSSDMLWESLRNIYVEGGVLRVFEC